MPRQADERTNRGYLPCNKFAPAAELVRWLPLQVSPVNLPVEERLLSRLPSVSALTLTQRCVQGLPG